MVAWNSNLPRSHTSPRANFVVRWRGQLFRTRAEQARFKRVGGGAATTAVVRGRRQDIDKALPIPASDRAHNEPAYHPRVIDVASLGRPALSRVDALMIR